MRQRIILLAALLAAFVTTGSALAMQGDEVRAIIRITFADQPKVAAAMIIVADCESTGLIHRLPDGSLRPNMEGSTARGAMQVLMRIHRPEFVRLGLDAEDDYDYFEYVRHLHNIQGFNPWNPSKHCWGDEVEGIMNGTIPVPSAEEMLLF